VSAHGIHCSQERHHVEQPVAKPPPVHSCRPPDALRTRPQLRRSHPHLPPPLPLHINSICVSIPSHPRQLYIKSTPRGHQVHPEATAPHSISTLSDLFSPLFSFNQIRRTALEILPEKRPRCALQIIRVAKSNL
jgi:hypothetical protein